MAISNGPNLGILVDGAIGEVHYNALMQQWRAMDALVQPRVKSAVINTPPVSPSDGDCYIVPSGATGVWSGNTNKIARYSSKQTAWEYYTPKNGWVVHNEATSSFIKYNGTAWVDPIINKADLVDGKVPASQLPSYVDDILEFPDLGSFPVTGESGKIYVAIDTGNSYRWSGSVYTKISQPLDEMPQAVAEAGTSDTLYAATARRIRQAIAAWWLTASSAFGRTLANVVDAAAGRTALGLGTASTATVTTSATDTTVGRLLKVGDFGLGGEPEPLSGSWNDLGGHSRLVKGALNVMTDGPFVGPYWLFGQYTRLAAGNAYFLGHTLNATNPRTFLRILSGGVWQSWVEMPRTGGDASFANLTTTGNTTLGDSSSDTVTVSGPLGVGGAPSVNNMIRVTGSVGFSGSTNIGVSSLPTGSVSGTGFLEAYASSPASAASAYTVATVSGYHAYNATKGPGSTITTQHGVLIDDQTQGVNSYGITSQVSAGTNKWNIYASGAAPNYFAGNVGVGTTPFAWGSTYKPVDIGGSAAVIGTSGAARLANNAYHDGTSWRYKNTIPAQIYEQVGTDHVWSSAPQGTAGNVATFTERMRITSTGVVRPGADNTQSLGEASYRWSTVFAGTGTINTSDAREKTPVAEFTSAEISAAKQLSKEIGIYQFLDSVAAKGDAARKHIGLTVQRAIEIMEGNGLDPFSYGFICYDKWDQQVIEHPAVEAVEAKDAWSETIEHEAELDEEGNTVVEAWTETIEHPAIEGVEAKEAWTEVTREAGDRYGFRYDQLNMFIARGIEARLAALEAA